MVDDVRSDSAPTPERGREGGETDDRPVPQLENPATEPEINLPPPPEPNPQPSNPQAPSLEQLIAKQDQMIANQNQLMQTMANLLQAQKKARPSSKPSPK
ncbi:hypothetical protein U9M48_031315 [Paspalum notatum var. saurae]|uniref:Uncharacterized protein n=1 Tax=Paspalum notatum var. saurae TaxID=547442 RepID=A0AAQ3U4U8_PASNO